MQRNAHADVESSRFDEDDGATEVIAIRWASVEVIAIGSTRSLETRQVTLRLLRLPGQKSAPMHHLCAFLPSLGMSH